MTVVSNHAAAPIPRRSPSQVMRLERLGSTHPMRLSFLRILLRRMQQENWRFDRPVWQVDSNGVGVAVYRAIGPSQTYSLVAFAHDLPDHMRSDRVIATAWDATFTLFDGDPTPADIDRLSRNVPLQEAGRITSSELSLSRANRSVRLFDHVVESLSRGLQPAADKIEPVGYLMRTTAVYGSGKFGAADRRDLAEREHFNEPFQIEMLSVWLTRQFVVDLVEHLAQCRGGDQAVRLNRDLRRSLGVGNSTGLGMAPFIIRHPILLNNWMMVREEALSRVRSVEQVDHDKLKAVKLVLKQARSNAASWHSEHPLQVSKLLALRSDLDAIAEKLNALDVQAFRPWNTLWQWSEQTLSLEGQEALLSVLLEPYGELIDGMAGCLSADEMAGFRLDGAMNVASLRSILENTYGWALSVDFNDPANRAVFWYVAEEKLEPRLGKRAVEQDGELERPLGVAHLASSLYEAEMLPIDLLRCKLAFFGASHFDPRSDRWVRISLFKGEPYPDELQ